MTVLNGTDSGHIARIIWMGEGVVYGEGYRI
jgi:hypothetical protein